MTLIDKKEALINEEWTNFTAVHNQGGKASCQEDPETFFIMRRSQFTCWDEELVESWYNDLVNAKNAGRNLLSEKYAWMMQHTAPAEFEKIKDFLTEPSPQAELLIEEITETEVRWMEEYSQQYPFMAMGNRPVHSYEDSAYDTSFETYLRGELHTYSINTLRLYRKMIKNLCDENKSMAVIIMEAMVKQYGYKDLADAEKQQKIRYKLNI